MTIQFQPDRSGPMLPNTARSLSIGQRTDPASETPTSASGRSSAGEPHPADQMQALVMKMQARLDARISKGDLDESQMKGLAEMMRTFEGAMSELESGAIEGLFNHREVAAGVKEALAALNSGVHDALESDDKHPGPIREQGGPLGLQRNLEARSNEPYFPVDRKA